MNQLHRRHNNEFKHIFYYKYVYLYCCYFRDTDNSESVEYYDPANNQNSDYNDNSASKSDMDISSSEPKVVTVTSIITLYN